MVDHQNNVKGAGLTQLARLVLECSGRSRAKPVFYVGYVCSYTVSWTTHCDNTPQCGVITRVTGGKLRGDTGERWEATIMDVPSNVDVGHWSRGVYGK